MDKNILNKNKIIIALSLVFVSSPLYAELRVSGELAPESSGVVYSSSAMRVADSSEKSNPAPEKSNLRVVSDPAPQSTKYKSVITHVGLPATNLPPLKGFANQLPLIEVLKQIIPQGWYAKKEKDSLVNISQLVSWRSDKDKNWVEILAKLANDYKFNATIDWTNQELKLSGGVVSEVPLEIMDIPTIEPVSPIKVDIPAAETEKKLELLPVPEVKTAAPSPTSNENNAQKLLAANVSAINKKDVVSKSSQKEWLLQTGKTLKENIIIWAKNAGWEVAWDEGTVDYAIDYDVTLTGNFDDDENGPIAQVALAYRQAYQPLVFSFKTGNRVLVIKNYMFEQKLYRESWQKYNKEN